MTLLPKSTFPVRKAKSRSASLLFHSTTCIQDFWVALWATLSTTGPLHASPKLVPTKGLFRNPVAKALADHLL